MNLDEDDCRIYIQELGQRHIKEESFIKELHDVMHDLSKANLAIPQSETVSHSIILVIRIP